MKGLIQRVTRASVTVDGEITGSVSTGLLLLLGVEKNDSQVEASALCEKVISFRLFADSSNRMNRSLEDIGGSLLIVPQFTLVADTSSGTRPGFSRAAGPQLAHELYDGFVGVARDRLGAGRVECGRFGADMKVSLVNDGPATFLLEVSCASN